MTGKHNDHGQWCSMACVAGLAVTVAGLLLSAGCYTLGSGLPREYRALYIPTFGNQTDQPVLTSAATAACKREFQNDGTVELVNANNASSILRVTLVKYETKDLRYGEGGQAKTAQEYRLYLTARVVMENATTGEVLLDQAISGDTDFDVVGDLTAAKRNALPDAAEDLAHEIVSAVVDGWYD